MGYKMIGRAMLSGLIATLAMFFLGFVGSRAGMQSVNWAEKFALFFGGSRIYGFFFFFAAGMLCALVYVHFLHDRLPGTSWRRGMLFAVLMWIATGLLFAPMMHMGFFMGSVLMSLGTLVTYLFYGAILGYMYDA